MRTLEEQVPQRLFVGVPVSEAASLELSQTLPDLLPGRPVPRVNWHFTLRFLGDTEATTRDVFVRELSRIYLGSSFNISFDALGAFPDPRRARILWAGVGEGKDRLESLAQKVESAARATGFALEPKPFAAHLTLSRIRPPHSVTRLLASAKPIGVTMNVSEAILYRSELGGSTHSRYTTIARFPLS